MNLTSLREDRRSYLIAYAALFALAASLFFVLRAQPASAALCTFASVGTNNFNTAANWSCGFVPEATSTAIIPASTSTYLTANTSITAVSSTGNIYLGGFNLTFATGTISGNGSISATGTGLLVATSTVSVQGTVSSTSALMDFQDLLTILTGGTVTSTSAFISMSSVSSSGSLGSNSGLMSVTSTVMNNGTIEIGSATTTFVGNATNTAIGTIKNELGTLAVQADFENIGTYTNGVGTFSITGSGAQRIVGASSFPITSSFYNLFVSKSGGTATLQSNATSTNNVTLNSGTLALNDKTLFVGGNWQNNGGTLTNAGGSSIVTLNGTSGQFISAETGFGQLIINKTSGNATTTGNITALAVTVTAGSLDLKATTMTISGNGGTNPFTVSGTFNAGTSTVIYNTNAAATTQVASTNFYNLTITGTAQTYNFAASTTASGVFTVGTGATVTIAAAVDFTTLGTMVNTGVITVGAAGKIVHRAEAFNFANESGTTITTLTTPATLYVQVQDSNRNLDGTSVETISVTVTSTAAAGFDTEARTLTETSVSSGIFRSAGLSVIPSSVTSTGNGLFEISASGSGLSTYVDAQDTADSNPFSISITYSTTGGAAASTASSGGGGGGSPIPSVTTSYQSYTAGTTGGTVQNPGVVPAHTLVKLPDDGNLNTQSDSAVYYVGADGRRHAFPNSKVYFTWYADFSGVQVISADQLALYTLGANITYKPGKKMVKFTTDPKVYAVGKGGLLRWIKTEAIATELYGSTWNKMIDDISDAFYTNYDFGPDVSGKSDFDPALVEASVTYPSDSLK